jgi:hypothetical protein
MGRSDYREAPRPLTRASVVRLQYLEDLLPELAPAPRGAEVGTFFP